MPRLRSKKNNKKLPTKITPSKKLKTNKKSSKIGSKESKLKSRQRNVRKSFSKDQTSYLERQYSICRYPDIYMKEGETERFFFIFLKRGKLFYS
uniref:Uncharacterized protein n=1 Tax=Meloidogyne enterolobii TaxID=390850 RepID=A0A6V7TKE9_MELEN|nr:unnamed protein product [Meloidogyne enterolobii]